jgi:hypothetical protein
MRRQVKRVLLGQCAGDRADQGDLEAVEDPGDPEAEDDEPVPAAPRQPVEPAGNHRLDGLADVAELTRCCGAAHVKTTDERPFRLRFDSGGRTRTCDTRIMIPLL